MSNGIESNWGSGRDFDVSEMNREVRLRLCDQSLPERVRASSETKQEQSPEAVQVKKDAEDIARSNPPDKAALDALASHLYDAYMGPGDNWSGQVEYARKVNEELKNIGSIFRVMINTATRAFKDEVEPGEAGCFSIVDTDGKVIVSKITY